MEVKMEVKCCAQDNTESFVHLNFRSGFPYYFTFNYLIIN